MMQKILFILHLPPPVHGSSVVGQQIRDSKIIHEGLDSRFVNLNTSASTDAIGQLSVGKIFRYAGILLKIFSALLFRRPSLVYIAVTVKGGGFYKDLGVISLVKLFRVPIVYHLHNKGVAAVQDRKPYKWLYPWVFRKSHVILLSKYLYPDISRFVPESAVSYCPNGIEDQARDFERKINPDKIPTILFLSNLIESKGVFVLLEACAILKMRGISFRAEFIGGEADVTGASFQKRCEELQISDSTTYLGKQYGKDKEAAFGRAGIFCLPTYYHNECLPLVLLEAMQWQLPVISTPEGGIADVVLDGETGFIVPQRDAVALANRLEQLINDPELRLRMGKAGHKHYEENFTAERFERQLRECLLARS